MEDRTQTELGARYNLDAALRPRNTRGIENTRIHAAWCKRRARGRPPRDRRIPGATQTEAYTLYTELSLLLSLFSPPFTAPRTHFTTIPSLRASGIPYLPVALFFPYSTLVLSSSPSSSFCPSYRLSRESARESRPSTLYEIYIFIFSLSFSLDHERDATPGTIPSTSSNFIRSQDFTRQRALCALLSHGAFVLFRHGLRIDLTSIQKLSCFSALFHVTHRKR